MSNGSKNTKHKLVHRNFMVDYRDAKYQGEVSDYLKLPNGTGMLMNIDYLLVISYWQEGMIDGPTFILFPEGNIYYGDIKETRVSGYNSYQISKRNFIYSYSPNHTDNLFFIDLQLTKNLTAVKMPEKEVTQILSSYRSQTISQQEATLQYFEIHNTKKKMEVICQLSYSNDQEKWEAIGKITGVPVPLEFRNFKSFLKQHFNTRAPSKDIRLELTQTADFLELKYKKPGILCRIDEKVKNSNKVQLLGYYDSYEEKCDVYRKSKGGLETEVQEFCQGHTICYKKKRPDSCKANLQNYFRKSANFVNQFISTAYIHQAKILYQEIYLMIQGEISTKNAQIQLQMGPSVPKPEVNKVKKKDSDDPIQTFRNIELSEIKNEVFNRLDRKKSSNKGYEGVVPQKISSFSQNQSINSYQISQFKESPDFSPQNNKYRQYREDSTPKRSKEYLKYTENSPSLQERSIKKDQEPMLSRKKFSYLPYERNEENSYSIVTNFQRAKSSLLLNDRDVDSYSFHENNKYLKQPFPAKHNQSIGTLAQNYERLQEQLSQEKRTRREKDRGLSPKSNLGTPTSRSPSRWSYLKGSALSRGRREWR